MVRFLWKMHGDQAVGLSDRRGNVLSTFELGRQVGIPVLGTKTLIDGIDKSLVT